MRVLVIDDEATVRELLGDYLAFLGYEVDVAADGLTGLALLEQGGHDLVLTDLSMPGMTGWEVVEAVRRRAPAINVIMITGSTTAPNVERARQWGLTLVQKPISFEELRAVVRQVLGPRGD